MPSQRSPRTTPKTTSAPPSNGGRRPNGPSTSRRPTGNGGNGKPNGAWPVELVLAAEVELSIEGRTPPSMGSPSARGARPCCPAPRSAGRFTSGSTSWWTRSTSGPGDGHPADPEHRPAGPWGILPIPLCDCRWDWPPAALAGGVPGHLRGVPGPSGDRGGRVRRPLRGGGGPHVQHDPAGCSRLVRR
jgi:hypothetical protein